ncbi:MAG: hypothetical protein WA913_01570 [Pricia sp.]
MCRSDDEPVVYDCSAVTCYTGFTELYIEVLDSENGKNAFLEGIYAEKDIRISGSETVRFELKNALEKELLVVSDTIWQLGAFEYTLVIGNNNAFDISIFLDRAGGEGCCSNILSLKSLSVNDDVKEVELLNVVTVEVD